MIWAAERRHAARRIESRGRKPRVWSVGGGVEDGGAKRLIGDALLLASKLGDGSLKLDRKRGSFDW